MSSVPAKNLDKVTRSHLACTYAALILHDEGLNVNGQKIQDLVHAAGVQDFEKFYAKLYANNLNSATIESAIATGGAGAASAPSATQSSAPAPAAEAKKEEKKPEAKKEEPKKEEEEDYDMGDLFG